MNKETRIGLISNLRVGKDESSDHLAIVFDCRFGITWVVMLRVVGAEAVKAIVDFGASDLSHSAKACLVTSLEPDGAFGASCRVGFAGFIEC